MYKSQSQQTDESTLIFKNNKVITPDFYLRAKLKKKDLRGNEVWTISSTDYIKLAMENVEDRLPSRAVTPMSQEIYPETDLYHELDQDVITSFQELIWQIEMGSEDFHRAGPVLSRTLVEICPSFVGARLKN